jgi:protein TonB
LIYKNKRLHLKFKLHQIMQFKLVLVILILSCSQMFAQEKQKVNGTVSLLPDSQKVELKSEEKEIMMDSENFEPVPVMAESDKTIRDTIFEFAEVPASYQGGDEALLKFISSNLNYPEDALDEGIQGKVFIKFVIYSNGQIGQIQVVRGIRGYSSLEKEAIRVIKLTNGRWNPAHHGGKAVSFRYLLPISFNLK